MKHNRSLRGRLVIVSLLFTSTVLLAQSGAQKTLDRFKSMVGTWQGKSPTGDTSEVTYHLAAGGTAVMADMHMAGDDMMSMYYVNGGDLLMTHFCPSNNQPRMKAVVSPDLTPFLSTLWTLPTWPVPMPDTCIARCFSFPTPTITPRSGPGSLRARKAQCISKCSARSNSDQNRNSTTEALMLSAASVSSSANCANGTVLRKSPPDCVTFSFREFQETNRHHSRRRHRERSHPGSRQGD
jgi:hypothetical protein